MGANRKTETFEYDDASNLTSWTSRDNKTIIYTYDELNRLVTKSRPGSERDITYRYDIAGRIVLVEDEADSTTYKYDRLSRVEEVVDQEARTVSYVHDGLGRRTKLTCPDNSHITYEYDKLYELTFVDYNDGNSTNYYYDSLGNRTGTNGGSAVSYSRNRLNQYTAVDGTDYSYDNNGNLIDDGTSVCLITALAVCSFITMTAWAPWWP